MSIIIPDDAPKLPDAPLFTTVTSSGNTVAFAAIDGSVHEDVLGKDAATQLLVERYTQRYEMDGTARSTIPSQYTDPYTFRVLPEWGVASAIVNYLPESARTRSVLASADFTPLLDYLNDNGSAIGLTGKQTGAAFEMFTNGRSYTSVRAAAMVYLSPVTTDGSLRAYEIAPPSLLNNVSTRIIDEHYSGTQNELYPVETIVTPVKVVGGGLNNAPGYLQIVAEEENVNLTDADYDYRQFIDQFPQTVIGAIPDTPLSPPTTTPVTTTTVPPVTTTGTSVPAATTTTTTVPPTTTVAPAPSVASPPTSTTISPAADVADDNSSRSLANTFLDEPAAQAEPTDTVTPRYGQTNLTQLFQTFPYESWSTLLTYYEDRGENYPDQYKYLTDDFKFSFVDIQTEEPLNDVLQGDITLWQARQAPYLLTQNQLQALHNKLAAAGYYARIGEAPVFRNDPSDRVLQSAWQIFLADAGSQERIPDLTNFLDERIQFNGQRLQNEIRKISQTTIEATANEFAQSLLGRNLNAREIQRVVNAVNRIDTEDILEFQYGDQGTISPFISTVQQTVEATSPREQQQFSSSVGGESLLGLMRSYTNSDPRMNIRSQPTANEIAQSLSEGAGT